MDTENVTCDCDVDYCCDAHWTEAEAYWSAQFANASDVWLEHEAGVLV